jgi:DNA-binding LacI/PurR family transcriptional regulator
MKNNDAIAVDYGRLRNDLKGVLDQQYRPGDRIPSERRLASDFKVSPTTISRALNDLSRAGIVRRVRGSGTYLCDVAQHTSGEPEHAERSASMQGRHIGIVGGIGDPQASELIEHRVSSAIEREIQAAGGRTRVIDTQRQSVGTQRSVIDQLLRDGVESFILIDNAQDSPQWISPMLEAGLPIVLALVSGICEWPVDCVRIDDGWGVFNAAVFLLEQGHRRLAFLGPPSGAAWWSDARAAAFGRAIAYWNSTHDAPAIGTALAGTEEGWTPGKELRWASTGQTLGRQFLQSRGYTAVVAANDAIALTFQATIEAAGLRIPEDISLIGYDNSVEAASTGLSTLDAPAEQLGIQAARLCRPRGHDVRTDLAIRPILLVRNSIRSTNIEE